MLYFGTTKELIGQHHSINFHCVSLLDVLDRLVSAFTNLTWLRTEVLNYTKDFVDLAEFLLEGAVRNTAFVDDSGTKNTSQMWPIEDGLDSTFVMDKFFFCSSNGSWGAIDALSQVFIEDRGLEINCHSHLPSDIVTEPRCPYEGCRPCDSHLCSWWYCLASASSHRHFKCSASKGIETFCFSRNKYLKYCHEYKRYDCGLRRRVFRGNHRPTLGR